MPDLTLGGGAQFMDSVFSNAANTAEVPSYWLINAVVSYDVNTHLTLRLNGTNLADEDTSTGSAGATTFPDLAGRSWSRRR